MLSRLLLLRECVLTPRRAAALLQTKIHVYELPHVRLLDSIETALNARGLCVLAAGEGSRLAYPQHGSSEIESESMDALLKPSPPSANAASGTGSIVIFDALRVQREQLIRAHKGALAALTINHQGSILASASVRGTVIRIYALPSGQLLHACRRGTYAATIRALAFAPDAPLLCVASQTGTVHVFRFGNGDEMGGELDIVPGTDLGGSMARGMGNEDTDE